MTAPDDDAVREDDAYVENLRAGGDPDPGDEVGDMLADWRDETKR